MFKAWTMFSFAVRSSVHLNSTVRYQNFAWSASNARHRHGWPLQDWCLYSSSLFRLVFLWVWRRFASEHLAGPCIVHASRNQADISFPETPESNQLKHFVVLQGGRLQMLSKNYPPTNVEKTALFVGNFSGKISVWPSEGTQIMKEISVRYCSFGA